VALLGQGLTLAFGIWVLLRSQPTTSEKPTMAMKLMSA
jgi:hypothetical protein